MKDTIVEILGRANGAAVTRADLREVMRTDRPTAWGKPTGKKLTDSQTTLVGKAITDLIEDGTLEHLEVTVGASKMAALALAPPTQRTGSAAMPTKVGAVAARCVCDALGACNACDGGGWVFGEDDQKVIRYPLLATKPTPTGMAQCRPRRRRTCTKTFSSRSPTTRTRLGACSSCSHSHFCEAVRPVLPSSPGTCWRRRAATSSSFADGRR